jgi:hypothetical protein
MTTATTEMFATDRAVRPAGSASPLLSVLAVILGVSLRESLAAESAANDDAGYTWGM